MPASTIPTHAILPSTAVLEMTYRCNHACVFCSCPWYAGMITPGEEMPIAEWKQLTSTYAEAGVHHFSFTGGEAILKEGLAELIEHVASIKAPRLVTDENGQPTIVRQAPSMNLLSNGRALTDDWLRLCARHNILISISMPGLHTLREHTGTDTTAEHLLGRFARAKELGCSSCCGVAVTKRNLPELYETLAAAILAGADEILLNRFLPGGRGLAYPDLLLTAAEVRQAAAIADEVLGRTGRVGHFGTECPRCLINPDHYQHIVISTGCSAARDYFTVGANGWLRACNHSPVELLRWNRFEELPSCPEWMHFIRRDYVPSRCAGCADFGDCVGGCREAARVTTGNPTADDPLFATDNSTHPQS